MREGWAIPFIFHMRPLLSGRFSFSTLHHDSEIKIFPHNSDDSAVGNKFNLIKTSYAQVHSKGNGILEVAVNKSQSSLGLFSWACLVSLEGAKSFKYKPLNF